jgi:tetratricopeptide (TPR) repeat protein
MNLLIKLRILGVITVIVLFIATYAYAKTASQVFEAVSPSIVIILTLDTNGDTKGFGSGVVLEEGVVATNYHVIREAWKIQVIHQGNEYPATLQKFDWDRDVCTLSVSGFKAPTVVIGDTNQLKIGAQVYAIGAPQGLDLTLTEGIVSSLRKVKGGHYIQTTAAISPGSSGGGLFDEQGRLLGLTSFYIAESQSLNFAVPIEWIEDLPKQHIAETKETESSLDWINKALLLEKNEDWPALVHHSLCWIKAKPEEPIAWSWLGTAYERNGQNDKAIEAYRHALRIAPEDAINWSLLGHAYGIKEKDKAIEAFQQALRINPEDALNWKCLGLYYGLNGQEAKSIEAYIHALGINPDDADGWYYLGNAYVKSEQNDKAIGAFLQSLRIKSDNAEAWNKLGDSYLYQRKHGKAIEAYQEGLRINPEDAGIWSSLAAAYHASEQITKSIEASEQALRIKPEEAFYWYNLGIVYSESGQINKAIEAYQQALRIMPEFTFALYNLGVAYKCSGQDDKALEVYKRLKRNSPTRADQFFEKVILP